MSLHRPRLNLPLGEQAISHLERGTLVAIHVGGGNFPEITKIALRRETMQMVWHKNYSRSRPCFQGAVDVRTIKMIKGGKDSREFEESHSNIMTKNPRLYDRICQFCDLAVFD